MKVVLGAQRPAASRCRVWTRARATSPAEGLPSATCDVHRSRVQPLPGEGVDATFERVRARLFAYDIFPPRWVRYVVCPGPTISTGSLIVQRTGVGALNVESAVRVVTTWDTTDRGERDAGFRYVTLEGHPERGVASFSLRRHASGEVMLTIDARSEAGTIVARIGRPVARRLQLAITRAAVRRLSEA
jgi:uncharacterized protein (UPF0548 family)